MRTIRRVPTALFLAVACLLPLAASAAESYDNCTGFIDSVPATISTQGTWCLRGDLSTAMSSGAAITIANNNVTIDCNDFKLGGLAAGVGTQANGMVASDRLNITVRHCNIRGFLNGVLFSGPGGGGHVVEDNRFDGNTSVGVNLEGDGSVVRGNLMRDTGGSTASPGLAIGIRTISAVDILDNTVTGVLPAAGATGNGDAVGIRTEDNPNGSIDDNRVRGLVRLGSGTASGILNISSGRIGVAGNQVVGDASVGSTGLSCTGSNGRAKDNILNGFATAISGCADDGNVIAP